MVAVASRRKRILVQHATLPGFPKSQSRLLTMLLLPGWIPHNGVNEQVSMQSECVLSTSRNSSWRIPVLLLSTLSSELVVAF